MIASATSTVRTAASSSWIFPGWGVVLAGFVGIALGSPVLVLFTLGVFTKPLEADLGWTRAQISLVATVFTIVSTLTFPFVGSVLDRYGPRRVVLTSIPLLAIAYGALFFVPRSLPAFYLAWVVITIVGCGASNPAYCKAVAAWFDRRLGLAMGVTVAGQGVGAAAVPAIAYALIARYGWRTAYLSLAGILMAVAFTMNVFFLRDAPAERGDHPDGATGSRPTDEGYSFRDAIRTGAFTPIAAAFFLLGIMSTAILSHQVPMLVDGGMTLERAASVQVTYGAALTLGRITVGVSLDRFFAPRVLVVSLVGLVAGLAMYAIGATGARVFLCATLIGFGIGAEFDVLGYLIARYFGRRSYGKLYALVLVAFTSGGGLGAALFGVVRTAHGSYAPALWGVTATTVVAILILSRLGPYPVLPTSPSAAVST